MNLEAAYKKAIKRYGPDAEVYCRMDANMVSSKTWVAKKEFLILAFGGEEEKGYSEKSFADAFKDADRREALEKTSKS